MIDRNDRRVLKLNNYDVVPFELLKLNPICAYIYVWLQRRSEDGVYTVLNRKTVELSKEMEIPERVLKNSLGLMKRKGYITFMYEQHRNKEFYGSKGLKYIFLLYQHEIEDHVIITDETDEQVSILKRLFCFRAYHSDAEVRRAVANGVLFSDIKPQLKSHVKRNTPIHENSFDKFL